MSGRLERSSTFVETNVLVYAHDLSETRRRPIAQALLDDLWSRRTGAVSTQVMQEFYVVATRKFDPPMSPRTARAVIAAYSTWPVVRIDAAMILAAAELEERHTFSFWDALIVEAARRSGSTKIVSEDLQTSRRIGRVVIENPFVS